MKLLIATGLYPPDTGGPATYAKLFEDELPKRGIDVSVLSFSTVRTLPPLVRHLAYAWRVFALARRHDVVLVQDTVSTGLPVALACICIRRPFVLRVPGDYAWEQGVQRFGVSDNLDDFQRQTYGLRVDLLRALQRFVVRRAARIIAPSKYLARIVEGWVPGKTVDVIYNGIEPVQVVAPRERPQGFLIVSIGRLVPWKGMQGIIRVVAQEPTWKAVIVGDGPQRTLLEHETKQLGCAERVTFVGQLSRAEALGWAKASDVFVLNSSYEGFSHTLLEVMSLDVPVIAWAVGGNVELIEDAPELPHDSADAALHGRILGVAMGKESSRERAASFGAFARTFTITRTVDETAAILRACVSS